MATLSQTPRPHMLSEDKTACARLVERGDPLRFTATMAAPVSLKGRLFALYAFNLEVARAPWVSAKPAIGAMRLQWWRDSLDDIARGALIRRHKIVLPLAQYLSPGDVERLDALIVARHRNLDPTPFSDDADLKAYLKATSGQLMVVASRLLGEGVDAKAAEAGFAMGVASFLAAIPALRARGRQPLAEDTQRVRDLALSGLAALNGVGVIKSPVRAAFLSLWQTRRLLREACAHPERVHQGGLSRAPLRDRLTLMRLLGGARP